MNDKCAAGTGRFYEAMARSFEMSLPEFSNLSLTAKNVIPITAQCTVVCRERGHHWWARASPWTRSRRASRWRGEAVLRHEQEGGRHGCHHPDGGCAKNAGLKQAIEHVLEAEGHRPEDRPAADGRAGRCRVRPPEGHGPRLTPLNTTRRHDYV